MITRRYRIRFLTPAFLGDAEQNARWRTPPFKHSLREWWRVAYFADHASDFSLQVMRHEEGLLFGNAWLDDDFSETNGRRKKISAQKSLVRIRLETEGRNQPVWAEGHQRGVAPMADGLNTSYAWFGLLDARTKAPLRSGIKPAAAEGQRIVRMAWPEQKNGRMRRVMQLISDFGQLGSRSRGGWGALHIDDVDSLDPAELGRFARPLQDCLAGEWPASFASDAGGLMLWNSRQNFEDWSKLMRFVALRRKEVRESLKSLSGADLRAVLGSAKGGDRLANPLRWRPVLEANGNLRLQIFAMPWRVTGQVRSITISDRQLASAWQAVTRTLDQHNDLERSAT
ncbi:MAG: hypothetical protein RQ741_12600 [Wenzhouxiangellaceae bacterium]|nr:hypothetical protein [Wenzhouxiangellaceae bacterium]